MTNGINVDEESFAKLPIEDQLVAIYRLEVAKHAEQCKQVEMCERRFAGLDKRKLKDSGFAGTMGLIGGFLAIAAKKMLGLGP